LLLLLLLLLLGIGRCCCCAVAGGGLLQHLATRVTDYREVRGRIWDNLRHRVVPTCVHELA
jgi:hypothetical protein